MHRSRWENKQMDSRHPKSKSNAVNTLDLKTRFTNSLTQLFPSPLAASVFSTRCIWVVRSVRAPVPAMTSHIMIGCDDVIRLSLAEWLDGERYTAMEVFYKETKENKTFKNHWKQKKISDNNVYLSMGQNYERKYLMTWQMVGIISCIVSWSAVTLTL